MNMTNNRLQKLTEEQAEIYMAQCEKFLKYQRLDKDEIVISRTLLDETVLTLEHARKFIISRNKMHPSGVELYDECTEKLRNADNFVNVILCGNDDNAE